jgi:hypothetical protein
VCRQEVAVQHLPTAQSSLMAGKKAQAAGGEEPPHAGRLRGASWVRLAGLQRGRVGGDDGGDHGLGKVQGCRFQGAWALGRGHGCRVRKLPSPSASLTHMCMQLKSQLVWTVVDRTTDALMGMALFSNSKEGAAAGREAKEGLLLFGPPPRTRGAAAKRGRVA